MSLGFLFPRRLSTAFHNIPSPTKGRKGKGRDRGRREQGEGRESPLMPIHSLDLNRCYQNAVRRGGTTVTIDYSVVCRKRKMFAENGIKSPRGDFATVPNSLGISNDRASSLRVSFVECTRAASLLKSRLPPHSK